jgi:DNA-binding NarL/FixJ family response regulator
MDNTAESTDARCFICGDRATPHDSLALWSPAQAGRIDLHARCTVRFTLDVLNALHAFQPNGPGLVEDLSPREVQILEGIMRGERYRDIADRLGITERTVKNHAYEVRQKLGAKTGTEAAVRALRSGLLVERVDRPAR